MLKTKIVAFIVIVSGVSLHSEAAVQDSQLHFRTGMLSGSFKGDFAGSFSVPAAIDWDYEIFLANDLSYAFRFTMALDSPDSRPYYLYAGTGIRHYLDSKGMITEQSDDEMYIKIVPRFRYYVGGDVGVSQVIAKSFGAVVQAISNMFDFGAHVGFTYRIRDNFGVEGQLGASLGYGFSSVAENGSTTRALVGAFYYF